jgi:hypothetical protein
VSADSFITIIWPLLWTVRPLLLFFIATNLTGATPTWSLFWPLIQNEGQWQSNIAELDWSSNVMTSNDLNIMLAFVKWQPNLKHLNLGGAIVPESEPETCFVIW